MGRTSAAAALAPAIPENDPAWLAAMNAPYDDAPETEQELRDLAEARAAGRFSSAATVRQDLDARRPR